MSLITYNTVTLPYASTTQFLQEAVYDDIGHTDHVLNKFTITVQSLVNANYVAALAPSLLNAQGSPSVQNPAEVMFAIRSLLLSPRKSLTYVDNGFSVLPLITTGNQGTVDAKNGPLPQSCNIVQVTATTFVITYTIITHRWENNLVPTNGVVNNTNQASNPILSNRWTESVLIDASLYSTRTRHGRFMIRTDNIQGLTPDEFRQQMASIAVPTGFLRQESRFEIMADGSQLDYTIVDKEVFRIPPPPAFEAHGIYTEFAPGLGAIMKFARCHVHLRGRKPNSLGGTLDNQYSAAIVNAAMGECYSRLRVAGIEIANRAQPDQTNAVIKANSVLTNIEVHVGIYDNTCDCTMEVRRQTDNQGFGFNPFRMGADGISTSTGVGPSNTPAPKYQLTGSARLVLQAAAYFDANAVQATIVTRNALANSNDGSSIPALAPDDSEKEANWPFGFIIPGQGGKSAGAR